MADQCRSTMGFYQPINGENETSANSVDGSISLHTPVITWNEESITSSSSDQPPLTKSVESVKTDTSFDDAGTGKMRINVSSKDDNDELDCEAAWVLGFPT